MIKRLYKRIIPENSRNDIRSLIRVCISPFYTGRRFYCNCCEHSFRKFLPKGNIKRENAQCPYCGSLERTRLLHLYLKNETVLFSSPLQLLHIAPEKCLFKIFKGLNIRYVDGDINPAYARNIIDITDIKYPDDSFDMIICSHVLGHIPDEAKAIAEIKRVLKKDGIALIMTLINPNSELTFEDPGIQTKEERLENYGEPDLMRLHGTDFAKRLEIQGFIVECIDYRKQLSGEINRRNCLGDGNRELIFKCEK